METYEEKQLTTRKKTLLSVEEVEEIVAKKLKMRPEHEIEWRVVGGCVCGMTITETNESELH